MQCSSTLNYSTVKSFRSAALCHRAHAMLYLLIGNYLKLLNNQEFSSSLLLPLMNAMYSTMICTLINMESVNIDRSRNHERTRIS